MLLSAKKWDFKILSASAVLVIVSGIAMASAAVTVSPMLAFRHWTWSLLGFAAMVLVARTNYLRWMDISPVLYAVSLAALVLVELAGAVRLGAERWLSVFGFSIQPSELAKLSTVLMLARYLAGQDNPLPPRAFWFSLVMVGFPLFLIFVQPDLGSASILGAIWLGMILGAGVSRRSLAVLALFASVALPFGWHLLKGYQKDRLLVFINPQADPLGAGYTIIQSAIAIGSGKFFGRGWFSGTQNQLSFLPERHSDFIFSVIGEEWGFLGCLVVMVLFAFLFARILTLAQRFSEPQGRLCLIGIFSWLAYQAIVNMGMVMGLLPVVGVPLPLVSYGGSSMITIWVALGLVQSIYRHEQ